MAATVFTGWRTLTPGKCYECGDTDGRDCDGRGTIYCECQTCPECSMFDGHNIGCEIGHAEAIAQWEAEDLAIYGR
jgi:hypothetical protein